MINGIAICSVACSVGRMALKFGLADRRRTWRRLAAVAWYLWPAALMLGQPLGGLSNLSARGVTTAGAEALTAGFVIAGPGPKRVLVRAAGPALAGVGVPGALAAARLELYDGATLRAANAGWDAGPDARAVADAGLAVGAFAFAPGSGDAALVATLPPGGYTARVVPARDGIADGVALVEIYDADPAAPARLRNLSARARCGSGADALIAGFVVAGDARNRLLVRAAGPALADFGVPGPLADPQLEVFRDVASVGYNDDWQANAHWAQLKRVSFRSGAFDFRGRMRDSALLLPAAGGAYTAAVTPASGAAGIALVEVYDTAGIRSEFPDQAFHLIGFGRVPGHGLARVTGGGAPARAYDPVTRTGNFWRIDESIAAAPDFPAHFQAALMSDQPLVVELDTMLDLSRVAPPSNGATAIAHPDLLGPGGTAGRIGLLSLGSNKTIYSAFGAGGFRRGTLRIDGKSNIILRNLTFRELWEWDEATQGQYDRNDWDYLTILSRFNGEQVIARAHHIWIDHCDFEKAYDGLFDIVHGADLITVSWCRLGGAVSGESQRWVRRQFEFLEANAARFPHYRAQRDLLGADVLWRRELFQMKANLVGNATDAVTAAHDRGHLNVTFHHDSYESVTERMPRMRFGNAHVFNLVVDSTDGQQIPGLALGGVIATSEAAVHLEDSWFLGVGLPANVRVGLEPVGKILIRDSYNIDLTTGAVVPLASQLPGSGETFAWNVPAAATGITGWPVAGAGSMPAGYVPDGTELSSYRGPSSSPFTYPYWVGVLVPADAAEADAWRARWHSIGP